MQKQIDKVLDERKAIAPYNFVELPDCVVSAQLECNGKLRDNDRYWRDRHTGRIECTLTTSSPLYTRCGLTLEQFQKGIKAKDLPEFFYTDPVSQKPVISGSSLRGMLRTLVEIVSYSKINRVTDRALVYRSVGDTSSLGKTYRDRLLKKEADNSYSFLMQAGYATIDPKNGKWYIQPAKPIVQGASFARIEKNDIPHNLEPWHDCQNAKKISVTVEPLKIHTHNKDRVKGGVKLRYAKATPSQAATNGVLVKTGPLPPRKHMEFVFGLPDINGEIEIPDEIIQDYKEQLTDRQKEIVGETGILKHMQPLFYLLEKGKLVFLGHAMMFRLPYKRSPYDFIPENLRKESRIDIADAIFGFVRREKQPEGKEQSRAGRVFISDATCTKVLEQGTIVPKILASPKPTTFQHYLVQTSSVKEELKHYASQPGTETVIRGHKLYWHKGSSPSIRHENHKNASDTQTTKIKPIMAGVAFKFTIDFENLSAVELGALMWVLDIAADDRYRLSLGMGKPLGMGAVKIESKLYLSDRAQRYTQLFNGDTWESTEKLEAEPQYKACFEKYMLEQLELTGKFSDIPRIQTLLAMLQWPGPDREKTRYMEIDRQKQPRLGNDPNEYKARRVLPIPLQVMGISLPNNQTPSPPTVEKGNLPQHPKPKPNLKKNSSSSFLEGKVVEATVTEVSATEVHKGKKTEVKTKIIYQIEGSECPSVEEVYDRNLSIKVGDVVEVTIMKVNGNHVRKVKRC